MLTLDHELVLRVALEHSSASIEITNAEGRFVYVNARFTQLTGYSAEEALGHTPAELLRSDVHDPRFFEVMWETVRARKVWRGELVSRCKDGTLVHQLTTVVPACDDTGAIRHHVAIKQPLGRVSSLADMAAEPSISSDLVTSVALLEASEHRYRTMMQEAGDAIMIADVDSAFYVEANAAACEMFGYAPEEFRRLTGRMLTVAGQDEVVAALSAGVNLQGHAIAPKIELVRKDGSRFWASMRVSAYELGGRKLYVNTTRDVSEQVRREQQLRESNAQLERARERLLRSERLAALGQLSATVAHEINNPLQFVELNLEGVHQHLKTLDIPEHVLTMQADALEGVGRIAEISRDLGRFARIERSQTESVDLNEVVRQACRMANTQIRHRARLELELGARSSLIADRGKLAQLVTNLVVNAAHAIEEGHADVNHITARTSEADGVLVLEIEDTGEGISQENTERIFDPFFTTKPRGGGTGLGLAVCMEVVRLHRGTIEVHSELGRGSRFEIRLPVDNGFGAAAQPERTVHTERRGRILLIDDDLQVLRAFERVLASRHEVVTANGGEDALEVLGHDRAFDVILCDLMMPVTDGVAIHAMLTRDAPDLLERVVFCSGGAFTARAQEFAASVANVLLEKPVRPTELRSAIAEVMTRTGGLAREAPEPPHDHVGR